MAIKLLKKNEIQKLKSSERAREIAEGLKLSRKVDSLRDLTVSEEEKYERFREESLSAIQKEIDTLNNKKRVVLTELKEVCEQRDAILPPLIEREHKVTQQEIDIKKREEEIEEEISELQKKKALVLSKEKEINKSLKIQKENEERINQILLNASNREIEAEGIRKTALTIEEKAYQKKKELEEAMSILEGKVREKEKNVLQKEKEIEAREKEVTRQEKIVRDRRGIVERALQRLKKVEKNNIF